MTERTAKRLADGFEPTLRDKRWTRSASVNLICESEDEAVLLAHELKKRGWKAEVTPGWAGASLKPVDAVRVTGPATRVVHARMSMPKGRSIT